MQLGPLLALLCAMLARLPLMAETPFQLDSSPLREAASPHAGALATSRVFRFLGFPDLIGDHLHLYQPRRGCIEDQMIETILMLQTIGGDCPDDVHIRDDGTCLERGLGYQPPKPTALRGFLDRVSRRVVGTAAPATRGTAEHHPALKRPWYRDSSPFVKGEFRSLEHEGRCLEATRRIRQNGGGKGGGGAVALWISG